MNSLPKTVTRQRRGCDLNPGPSAPESITLTTRLRVQVTKQQVEEKLTAVSVLRAAPGIDRAVITDVESTLAAVTRLCTAREHKLQHALKLVRL